MKKNKITKKKKLMVLLSFIIDKKINWKCLSIIKLGITVKKKGYLVMDNNIKKVSKLWIASDMCSSQVAILYKFQPIFLMLMPITTKIFAALVRT